MKSTNVANSAPTVRHHHMPMPALSVVWQSRWGLPSGYAVSSEALALELLSGGVELIYRPTPWHMPGVIHHPALRAAAARAPRDDAIQVSYDQADLFFTNHPGYKIGYTMLEVDGLPREWVAACNAMDEIWTPGHWGATVFADAGVTRPIVVMPLGTIRRVFALMDRRTALPGDSPSSRSSNGGSAKRRRCCCAPMQQHSRDAMMCCWCCA